MQVSVKNALHQYGKRICKSSSIAHDEFTIYTTLTPALKCILGTSGQSIFTRSHARDAINNEMYQECVSMYEFHAYFTLELSTLVALNGIMDHECDVRDDEVGAVITSST